MAFWIKLQEVSDFLDALRRIGEVVYHGEIQETSDR